MFKLGYKILSSARLSWVAAGKGIVMYRKNRWTRPAKGCGPLCVVATYERALELGVGSVIVACVYIPSDEKAIWTPDLGKGSLRSLPAGTRLASAVMCLE